MAHGLGSRDRLEFSTFLPFGPGLFVPGTIRTALYEGSSQGFCPYRSICPKQCPYFHSTGSLPSFSSCLKCHFLREDISSSPLISISTLCCFSKSTSHDLQLVLLYLVFISLLLIEYGFHRSRESIFCSPSYPKLSHSA